MKELDEKWIGLLINDALNLTHRDTTQCKCYFGLHLLRYLNNVDSNCSKIYFRLIFKNYFLKTFRIKKHTKITMMGLPSCV